MKFLLLLLLPISVVCQDSSLVKWNAKKRGNSPTDISLVITADIKKGYFIHPCESCSFNDWNDEHLNDRTDIDITADSNWTVKLVFSKNKYKQKTDFTKTRVQSKKDVIRNGDTTQQDYTYINYLVNCRVYNKMKLFRGIELTPSDTAIARYKYSIQLEYDTSAKSDQAEKKKDRLIKDAQKTLANTLIPPKEILLTIRYTINGIRQVSVFYILNTYKSKKVWGWKKTPRHIVNQETAPLPKTEDK
jgi:hypothetical protein